MAADLLSANYKIHLINVNSIQKLAKRVFLQKHINDFKPDMILLSETCLKSRNRINFHRYNLIRTDSSPGFRGTGILLKDTINFKQFFLPFTPNFEYTAITIKTSLGLLYVFSIYIHSGQLADPDSITGIYNLIGVNDLLIIGGDFNARHVNWHNSSNNANGLVLNNFLTSQSSYNCLKLVPSLTPSRISTTLSFIDLFLLSGSILSSSHSNAIEYESDHSAIELWVSLPRFDKIAPPILYDFAKTNWTRVKEELDGVLSVSMPPLNTNLSVSDIESYVDSLETSTLRIVNQHTPKMEINTKYNLKLSELTLKCIREKKMLRRRWYNTGRSNNMLRAMIKRLSQIINELIQVRYAEKLTNHLNLIKPGPMLFKDIKNFANTSSKKLPVLESCSDDASSASLIASYFSNVHNNSPAALSANVECPPNVFANELESNPVPPLYHFNDSALADGSSYVSSSEYKNFVVTDKVKSLIKSRKSQKSAGASQISNYILKRLPPSFVLFLTILINHSLNLSYFPLKWRHATVIPIPKGSVYTQVPQQYRPISLLSPLSKIYELIIKINFQNCLERFSINNKLQFGFTQGKSTSQAITYLLEDIHTASFKKFPTIAVSIDLKKAFDSVWINGLLFKMHLLNFPKNIIYLIYNFMKLRSFSVKYNNKFSNKFFINAGVPQGSILGPILFNFFLYDFPAYADTTIKTLFYADDILLYTARKNVTEMIGRVNVFLQTAHEYLVLWKLEVNYQKCQVILFRKSDTHISRSFKRYKMEANIRVHFGGQTVVAVKNVKYLGIVLNNKLSTIPHVNKIHSAVMGALTALKNIFRNRNISSVVKNLCYKQLIRTIITYCFSGWCSISSHQMLRLRRLERRVLYMCLPYKVSHPNSDHRLLPKTELYGKFKKMERLDKVLTDLFIKSFSRLEYSDIPELSRLVDIAFLRNNLALNNDKYMYRCFPPSLLFYLHLKGKIYINDKLIFYNRRCHFTELNNLVYDLIE